MATLAKDFLYPGKWRLVDGRIEDFSPQRVLHLKTRMQEMLKAELPVPLAWEHQPDAVPLSRSEMAKALEEKTKGICGHATTVSDGPRGGIAGLLEVPDDAEARRVETIRFVSPQIETDFVDGTNRLWPGESIVHLAVTGRPVQHTQQPFRRVAMSLARPSIQLSLDGYQGKAMADEKDDKPKGKEDDAPPAKEEKPDSELPADDVEHPDAGRLQETIQALRADGYAFPDDTTPENFLERLHTAVLTKQMATGNTPSGSDTTSANGKAPEQEASPPPLAMSQMAAELNALKSKSINDGRAGLKARAKSLYECGLLQKPAYDALAKEIGAVQLSIDRSGNIGQTIVQAKIEAYEEVLKNMDPNQPVALSWAGAGNRRTEPREAASYDNDHSDMRDEAKKRAGSMSRS